jgi:hypothetical protein
MVARGRVDPSVLGAFQSAYQSCLALRAEFVAGRRLQRYWDRVEHEHPGWHCQLRELDHAVRKDGFSHAGAHALLHGAPPARSRLQSFVLPSGEDDWRAIAAADHSDRLWVYKPATESCGVGIAVGGSTALGSSLVHSGAATIQEYRASPLLVGGLKWDLRCYAALVIGAGGVARLFLFYDGLARFATRKYPALGCDGEAPALGCDGARPIVSLNGETPSLPLPAASLPLCSAAHLTNYSLQLEHRAHGAGRFVEASDPLGRGGLDARGDVLCHKWSAVAALAFVAREHAGTLGGVLREATAATDLCSAGARRLPLDPGFNAGERESEAAVPLPSTSACWQRVGAAVSLAVRDVLGARQHCEEQDRGAERVGPTPRLHQPRLATRARRFELFGVDVLLESDGQPSVLELQRCPSLEPSSQLDLRVKTELVEALGRLLSAQAVGGGRVDSLAWQELDASPRTSSGVLPDSEALREWHRVEQVIQGEVGAVAANFERALHAFRAAANDGCA